MADYQIIQKGPLKLKGVLDAGIVKKKKKKSKEKEVLIKKELLENKPHKGPTDKRTKAEIQFENAKEERAAIEILKKASKSHKDRIMEFNEKLEQLTEHDDIQKVSWTK